MPLATAFRRVLVMAAAVLGVLALRGLAAPRTEELAREIGRLQRANENLETRLRLASGDAFYLVMDPGAGAISLELGGALLHQYPIRALELGAPRIAFVRQSYPTNWAGVVWSGGVLDPVRELDRFELEAAPGTLVTPPIPPPPEVRIPVPFDYDLHFDGGLVMEVRRSDAEQVTGWRRALRWWSARRREVVAALSAARSSSVRVRIVLDSEDADSLYRSLPPQPKLLILTSPPG